jgi:hypothetical protein
MDSKRLKPILKALREANVAKFTLGDMIIEFQPPIPPEFVVSGEETTPNQDMILPDGMFDPRAKLAEINRKVSQ